MVCGGHNDIWSVKLCVLMQLYKLLLLVIYIKSTYFTCNIQEMVQLVPSKGILLIHNIPLTKKFET